MNKNTRFGIIAIALAGLAGLGYYAYTANRSQAAGPAAPSGVPGKPAGGGAPTSFPTAVEVARVVASDFADDVAAVGTLKSNESVVLRPETSGRIASIVFRDGSIVAKGTVLVVLDASAATLKVQEAAVKLAEAKAAKMRIKAPFTGMVGLRNVSVGDYLKDGQDLINIEDVATLRVDFKLPESYLGRLGKGQSLEVVSDALPGERFKAVLDAVDPMVDQNGRSIAARARLDNAKGKLRPGMFVRVRLLFGERKGVLMVPEQAIVPGAQPAVFKVVDGKASLVKVRLGVRRAAQVEVVDGLADGDLVVTAGQLKLRDGAAVRPIGDGAPAAPPAQQPGATGTATGK